MTPSEAAILEFLRANPDASRGQIRAAVSPDSSDATVWRALKGLVEKGTLSVTGRGPATRYRMAGIARIQVHLERPYYERAPVGYRREFLDAYIPGKTAYLSDADRASLAAAGAYPESLPAGTTRDGFSRAYSWTWHGPRPAWKATPTRFWKPSG